MRWRNVHSTTQQLGSSDDKREEGAIKTLSPRSSRYTPFPSLSANLPALIQRPECDEEKKCFFFD